MTISNTSTKAVAQGNSANTVWPFTFLIPDQASLVFKLVDVVSGNETVVAPANYTVTGLDNPAGGSVTYPLSGSPVTSAFKTVVQRLVPVVQSTDFGNQSAAYPADIEAALDYVTMISQQVIDTQARSIVFSVADTAAPTLPLASARASKVLGFNSSGDPVALDVLTPGTTVSTPMIPVVTAPSIAAALAALGIPGTLIDLLIPSGTCWDYDAGGAAPAGFVYPIGQPCTSTYPDYRAKLIAAGSPYGTNGVDPLMPDRRSYVSAGKSNMGGVDNGQLTGASVLGAVLGNQVQTLIGAQLPVTTLTFTGISGTVNVTSTQSVEGQAGPSGSGKIWYSSGTAFLSSTGTFTPSGIVSGFGGGSSHPNVQPTFVCNKILKVH